MGSQAVAAFIGFWTFCVLLPYGYAVGELSPKQVAVVPASLDRRAALDWLTCRGCQQQASSLPTSPFSTSVLFSRSSKAMFACSDSAALRQLSHKTDRIYD